MGGGWAMSVDVRESFGSNYLQRALVARNYIGALGVQEAMYIMADRGGDGEPLDGRHAYRLDFAADNLPDVGAFWSLTMYDKGDCMLVPNDISRYSLGDRSPSLTRGADGSLTSTFPQCRRAMKRCGATGCPRRPDRSTSRCGCTCRSPRT
jgi:hypothetical protein